MLRGLGRTVRGGAREALEGLAPLACHAQPVAGAGLGDRIEIAAGAERTLESGWQSFERADRTHSLGRVGPYKTHGTASSSAGRDVKDTRFPLASSLGPAP